MSTYTRDLKNNPESVNVYSRTLELFLETVGSVDVVLTKGRCIHVRRPSGPLFPSFDDLAGELLGHGNPCDQFSVRGFDLYARLKTVAQVTADNSADNTDVVHGEFGLKEAIEGFTTNGLSQIGTSNAASGPGKGVRAVKKRKRPDGNRLIILLAMEKDFINQAPTLDELFDVVAERIVCPKPKRRNEYFQKAVAQLADTEVNKWLWRHEGDRVALTSVLPGGKGENI